MAPSTTRARRAAVLAIVAGLLLANPLYVGLFVDQPRSRSPTGYTAVAVDPADPEDQQTVVQELGGDDLFYVNRLAAENQGSPYGPRYRAPGEAAAALREARRSGSARADGEDVEFTLRRLAASHRFLVVDGESDRYYRFAVEPDGDGVVVTVERVDRSTVADYLVHRDARLYSSLPRYQRETVDEVLAADEYGYRPYNDEFHELTDDLLVKDGTYYVFRTSVHVDDFGPSTRGLVSFLLYAAGFLSLLVAAALAALSYRGSDEDGEDGDPPRTGHRGEG